MAVVYRMGSINEYIVDPERHIGGSKRARYEYFTLPMAHYTAHFVNKQGGNRTFDNKKIWR